MPADQLLEVDLGGPFSRTNAISVWLDAIVWAHGRFKFDYGDSGLATSAESRFAVSTSATTGAKPFHTGLSTSNGILGGQDMRREYLSCGSMPHPVPWHVWSATLAENIVIHEFTTASQWVQTSLEILRSEQRGLRTG